MHRKSDTLTAERCIPTRDKTMRCVPVAGFMLLGALGLAASPAWSMPDKGDLDLLGRSALVSVALADMGGASAAAAADPAWSLPSIGGLDLFGRSAPISVATPAKGRASAALAANSDESLPDKGDLELFGSSAGGTSSASSSTGGSSSVTTGISVGGGYYLSMRSEIGGTVTFADNDTETSVAVLGMYKYYFVPDKKSDLLVPFVAGYLGSTPDSKGNSAMQFGAGGGIKYFVAPNVSFNGELQYLNTSYPGYTSANTGLSVGLSVYFSASKGSSASKGK